jgi:hypothetical protein
MTILSLSGPRGPAYSVGETAPSVRWRLRRRDRARLLSAVMSFGAAVGLAAAAVLIFQGLRGRPAMESAAVAPPKRAWVEIVHPIRLYSLESPEFGREPRLYEARRHREGGGRQDVLSFGPAEPGGEPTLRLGLYRVGAEEAPQSRFFVDIARQAGQAGLAVVRSAQPGELPTRFGAFEVADISLAGSGSEASCLGFRLDAVEPGLRIAGFACGSVARPIDRRTLACTIDRLDLLAAGEDADLSRFFAHAELGRGKGCGGIRAQGPAPKTTGLDAGARQAALRSGDVRRNVPRREH